MTLTTAQAAMYVETDALQHAAQARAAFELAAASMGSLSRQASTVSSSSSLTSPLISTRSAVRQRWKMLAYLIIQICPPGPGPARGRRPSLG